jgi:hypothetical protein
MIMLLKNCVCSVLISFFLFPLFWFREAIELLLGRYKISKWADQPQWLASKLKAYGKMFLVCPSSIPDLFFDQGWNLNISLKSCNP